MLSLALPPRPSCSPPPLGVDSCRNRSRAVWWGLGAGNPSRRIGLGARLPLLCLRTRQLGIEGARDGGLRADHAEGVNLKLWGRLFRGHTLQGTASHTMREAWCRASALGIGTTHDDTRAGHLLCRLQDFIAPPRLEGTQSFRLVFLHLLPVYTATRCVSPQFPQWARCGRECPHVLSVDVTGTCPQGTVTVLRHCQLHGTSRAARRPTPQKGDKCRRRNHSISAAVRGATFGLLG